MLDDDESQQRALRQQARQAALAFLSENLDEGTPPSPPKVEVEEVSLQPFKQDFLGFGTQGAETTPAGGGPPPEPTIWACCHDDICEDLSSSECSDLGGTFHTGVLCIDDPCPTSNGACCVDTDCTIETPDACAGMDGVYQGDDTICDPNPCLQGACCVDFVCSIETEEDCDALHGGYKGSGSTCEPDPCVDTCCLFQPGGGGLGNLPCAGRFWHQTSCGFFNPDDSNFYQTWNGGSSYSGLLTGDPCEYCFCSVTVRDANTLDEYTFNCDGSCHCGLCEGPGFEISIDQGTYNIC